MTERGKHARPGRWRVYAEGAVAAGAVGVLAVSLSGGPSTSGRVITETNLHEAGSLSTPANTLVPGSSGRTISEPAPALALASHTSPDPKAGGAPAATTQQSADDNGDDGDNGGGADQSDSGGHAFGPRSGGQQAGDTGGSTGASAAATTTTTTAASTAASVGRTVTTSPTTRPPSYGGVAPRVSAPTTTTWPAQPAYGGDGAGGYLNGVGILSGMTPGYAPVYSYGYGYGVGY
jgi:hypothetical protein